MAIAEAKAAKWYSALEQILCSKKCDSTKAEKMAGRLSFTVTLAGNRIGRAFVKPFYAQVHSPLFNDGISHLMKRACRFFKEYLLLGVTSKRSARSVRRHINIWSDAAGVSGVVAFVAFIPEVGWLWSRWVTPWGTLDSLLERSDNQIQYQELAGVILSLHTLRRWIAGNLVTMWQDNQAVLHALLGGGSHGPEVNAVVGRFWIQVAVHDCAVRIGRVESRANLADGPSRNFLSWVHSLRATFIEPDVPYWLVNPWLDPLCHE